MNKNLKTIVVMILVALTGLLGACGPSPEQQAQAFAQARSEAIAAEAAKADAKLMTAKAEISKFATETARSGGYSATANCNVLPVGINKLSAHKNFPSSAPGDYREACVKEVTVMNAERKANADRAVARAKAKEQKLAAKKAKARQLARAKAEKAAEAKRFAAKPAKPVAKHGAKVATTR